MLLLNQLIQPYKVFICIVFLVVFFFLNANSQTLLRTNSAFDFSAISVNSGFNNFNYADVINFEESIYYRRKYNKESKIKCSYFIFTLYKKNSSIGICPYGIDFDLMSEHFKKNKANTFRYWNKMRMGLKFVFDKKINSPEIKLFDFIAPELYFSYLHLPHSSRGDLTTKARKGSFMFFLMVAPLKRSLVYTKFNVGSAWIKPYFKQESIRFYNMENSAGLNVEFEINKNGYNKSCVQSSRDIYRGITVFGGPEYNLSQSRIFMNIGVSITTENH